MEEILNEIWRVLADRHTLSELTRLLELEGPDGLARLVMAETTVQIQAKLLPLIETEILTAGNPAQVIEILPKGAVTAPYAFSIAAPATSQFIQQYTGEMIREVSQETALAVRNATQDAVNRGVNPRNTARVYRETVGLTQRQEQAVRNYRRGLEEGNRDVLNRALRDKRFDSTVRRALDSDQALSKDQIDKMVNRYRESSLKYRSEVIARTESLRAVSVGQEESLKQAMEQGAIHPGLRKQWVFTHDGRTRHPHRTIPALNAGGVKIDQVFRSSLGPISFPRSPQATASNTIQCRCRLRYFIGAS